MAEQSTLARPYAKAIFKLARGADERQTWSERLEVLAALAAHEEIRRLVRNPRVSAAQLAGIFRDAADNRLGEQGQNLVLLLAQNKRLTLLPTIRAEYEILRAQAEGSVDVDVATAAPLDEAQRERLAKRLAQRLGREVRLHCRVDETLMGGAVIRAGDLVIDGSVRERLDRLASAMVR